MSFRSRLIISFLLVSVLPIVGLAILVRKEMTSRLTAQYQDQVDAAIASLRREIRSIDLELADRLDALKQSVTDDNLFRLQVEHPGSDRSFVLDYAGEAMRLSGLAVLQYQDAEGRIISSGHFRNEFDRLDAVLVPRILDMSSAEGKAPLVAMRTPEGLVYVLTRTESVHIGGRTFSMVAGADLLNRLQSQLDVNPALRASLELPDGSTFWSPFGMAAGQDSVRASRSRGVEEHVGKAVIEDALLLPFIAADRGAILDAENDAENGADNGGGSDNAGAIPGVNIGTDQPEGQDSARIVVQHDLGGLDGLQRRIDQWILLTVLMAGLIAAMLVFWNAARVSRPLAELARKSDRIDLDRLDVDFSSDRHDEIGKLSGVLTRMTRRLKASTVSLREAERRAAVGDLARQVNHDVKNGLTPIRNIIRHLSELSGSSPEEVADTFRERSPALEASISYLETLSSHYGRLTQPLQKSPCDMGKILRQVAEDYGVGKSATIRVEADSCPPVLADPVALRRIAENLVDNALDSLEGGRGSVVIEARMISIDEQPDWIRMTVSDTGQGMDATQKSRIFENFYTSKETGTGLGLPIVRRLVMDLGGSISVQSEVGEGTIVFVDLPAAPSRTSKTIG